MTHIRPFWSLLLLLSLTAAAPAAPKQPLKDTPAVAVVRQFLADRAAGRLDAAYQRLSAISRQTISPADFAKGRTPYVSDTRGASPAFIGVAALFLDTHNTLHDTFTVLGPDPAAPGGVLVRAVSPAGTTAILRMATVIDPGTSAPHLDFFGSLKRTDSVQFARSTENVKRATSQSNLKQLSLAIIQYAFDHDNHLPDADKWVDEILPYWNNVKDDSFHVENLFRDPSAPVGEKYSYAFNRTLSGAVIDVPTQPSGVLDSIRSREGGETSPAASTVLLFESTTGVKNASDTGLSVPKPGRHLGGTDYAFADGHVRWLPDGTAPSFALTGK